MLAFFAPTLTFPLYVLLRYILRIRLSTVRENLQLCFPDHPNLPTLVNAHYRYMANFFIEIVLLPLFSARQISKAVKFHNMDELDADLAAGQKVIINIAHQANYEWAWQAITYRYPDYELSGIQKTQHSVLGQKFISWVRTRNGYHGIDAHRANKQLARAEQFPLLLYVASDQAPMKSKSARYFQFFGIKTPFQSGVEIFARRFKLSVYHLTLHTDGFGKLNCTAKKMHTAGEKIERGALIQAYVTQLEKDITAQPHTWLWSHKRWKNAPGKE